MLIVDHLKNNKIKILLIGFFLIAAFSFLSFVFLSRNTFTTRPENEFNRKTLLKIRDKLQIGDNYEKVLKNYWAEEIKSSGLVMVVYSADKWLLTMPAEFGAADWRMIINFDEGKVVGCGIRTADGQKPPNTPEDVGETNE